MTILEETREELPKEAIPIPASMLDSNLIIEMQNSGCISDNWYYTKNCLWAYNSNTGKYSVQIFIK